MITLDLPTPGRMRPRWAAFAAVLAARGWGDGCRADGPRWHYDDGGGNWCDLVVSGDRAVLVGHDHEYSDTYFRTAAEYFQEEETDLLAGAPDWWAPPAEAAMAEGSWVGFVYGFEAGTWRRAEYATSDGFTSLNPPILTDAWCRELACEFAKKAPGLSGDPDPRAFDAMLAADGRLTEGMLEDFVPGWDAAAGVRAAAAFLS
jgi:hypothetical protein